MKSSGSLPKFLAIIFLFSMANLAFGQQKVCSLGVYKGYGKAEYSGYDYNSRYIPMRDSVCIAVDIFLPKNLKEGVKVPTIMYQTRYVRSLQLRGLAKALVKVKTTNVAEHEIEFMCRNGYAVVLVDTRGSGASFGYRKMEFSKEELADGKDIVDWIIKQKWSDGKVGASGISYVGTTALLLLANQHPAVKAVIPRSAIYDLYNDVVVPNGIQQTGFLKAWSLTTRSLDQDNFAPFGKAAEKFVVGAKRVAGDETEALYCKAKESHKKNYDFLKEVFDLKYRDDTSKSAGFRVDDFSAHQSKALIEGSKTPIYWISGYWDGGIVNSSVHGFRNLSNSVKLTLGAWDHGPEHQYSPYNKSTKVDVDQNVEMLRFWDFYLKGIPNGIDKEPRVQYFTVGEEKWKTADSWPPKEAKLKPYYLSAGKKLSAEAVKTTATESYKIDYTHTTGQSSRYNSQTSLYKHGPTNYNNRTEESKKLLAFESEALAAPVTIAGNPMAHIHLAADATDAAVYVYLEEVTPDGTINYVTEGIFRAIHRKISDPKGQANAVVGFYHTCLTADAKPLTPNVAEWIKFDLQPVSYQFQKGSKIRVSIAGADAEHFGEISPKPTALTVTTGGQAASFVELPVME